MTTKLLFSTVLLEVAAAAATGLVGRQTACQDVHFFIARGSTEPYPGRQEDLVNAVCEGLSSCGYEDIIYPASFDNYCASAYGGVVNGTAQITAYAESCPNAKLVLTGYSQGGHVAGDILGGGGGEIPNQGCTQPTNTPLSPETSPGNKIVAVTFFGDVRHTASQSYNVGTGAAGSGILPRSAAELESLNKFSDLLHSWCFVDDPVCAGGADVSAHLQYFDASIAEAAAFVKSKI
ncbi:carbohydrate esterase family 5 protein [Annulohypoxylon maeteangense]|uniref:carbohydrate esterase family 5 protein n=1 Tax=Annulohypoxylon maeteangense TaxID=1927788 RepID=UPI002008D072|nr:carbohydrate esterase family 5 protein [Annulohypoxylon maeteangense]KAI0884890.1 carbohydrate esterase family 5 protein [Annulohypoxylon maeteangense]